MAFETSLKRLDEILERLQDEDLSLDEAVSLYKEGMDISLDCRKKLEEAKLKLSEINPPEEADGK